MRALVLLLLAASAFADTSVRPKASRVLFSLERTRCFGWCPIYKITVFSDGRLEYRGRQWVQRDQATAQLSTAQMAALAGAFQNFSSLRSYRGTDQDMPFAIVRYRGKRLRYRDEPDAPPALRELGNAIDRIVDIDAYIGPASARLEPPSSL